MSSRLGKMSGGKIRLRQPRISRRLKAAEEKESRRRACREREVAGAC